MRILIISFCLLTISFLGQSQNSRFKDIQNDRNYIWGYGQSSDPDRANKLALENLLTKISVQVESEFENIAIEENNNFKEYTKSVIRTYSNATLSNVKEKYYEKKGTYHVLRYIDESDMQKVFDLRESKMRSYISMGAKAQRELRIGDALRNYYYAYALYLSHPYQSELTIKDDENDVLIGILLNDRINSLFVGTDFNISNSIKYKKEKKTKYLLSCTYKGEKVNNLDFRFNNSNMHEVNNGLSEVYLYGAEQKGMDKLNLRIEYKYENKCHDKELSDVLGTVYIPFLNKSTKSIALPKKPIPSKKVEIQKQIVPKFATLNKLNDTESYYINNVKEIIIALARKDYSVINQNFTSEGGEMMNRLLRYGDVSVLPLSDTLKIVRLANETVVRSVPMVFYFKTSKKRFSESIVFTYNDERKISAISFALSDQVISDIVNHNSRFGSVSDKYTLIKFMEYYKTAYSLERIDYIESIFSDEALIIVGTLLKRKQNIDGMYESIGDNAVKYQQYTKKEYIQKLENVFRSKEYINIDFDDADVKKLNGEGQIYGIQISQHYYSSN